MKPIIKACPLATSALLLMLPICTAFASPRQTQGSANSTSKTASQQVLAQQKRLDLALAPIKSRAKLETYLKNTPPSRNPLDRLSSSAKKRFLKSLRFNEKGLTSFSYADLEGLTATEIYRILSLFGVQSDTSAIKSARIKSETDALIMQSPNVACGPGTGIGCGDGGGDGGGGGGGGGDRYNYKCDPPHTCTPSAGDYCTSNC
jgi:hypothetical protein